jgi:hypothetical protein
MTLVTTVTTVTLDTTFTTMTLDTTATTMTLEPVTTMSLDNTVTSDLGYHCCICYSLGFLADVIAGEILV